MINNNSVNNTLVAGRIRRGKIVTANKDQTLLDASLQARIPHFHSCGGKGKWTTCRIKVLKGEENPSRPNKKEAKLRPSLI